jgi:hypothetical protein
MADDIKELTTPPKQIGLTSNQKKWLALIGITIIAYYLIYKGEKK